MKRLFIIIALAALPVSALADIQEGMVPVAVKRLEQDGQLANITPADDVAKWLREAIDAGKARLATELPPILGRQHMAIELVSVPHPNVESPVNKIFVQWKKQTNPARFIPIVGRAVENKMDVYVALEARVTIDGETRVFPGRAHTLTDYRQGLRFSSALLEALEGAGKASFEAAISNVILEARNWAENNPHIATPGQPSI